MVRVLVVGSGAREHALAWRLARDGADVWVAPGNAGFAGTSSAGFAGTPSAGTPSAVALDALDLAGLADYVERERIGLTLVGPEAPLAAGLVDTFATRGLTACGPTQAAARIESSKAWTKDLLLRHGIPTGRAEVVTSEAAARHAVDRHGLPVVLKADGLAGGKGVFVCSTPAQVEHALQALFHAEGLRAAAEQVLVEECLEGPELSLLAFTDGDHLQVMPPVRDYKRLLDGDHGPNTGGMGGASRPAYAPAAVVDRLEAEILRPTLAAMAVEGTPFRGVLYAGLMLTPAGPRVLEFNCRFGDPECQILMPLLASSLVEAAQATAEGQLERVEVRWAPGRNYGVVLATAGYPDAPQLGDPITGIEALPEDVQVFHAGTRHQGEQVVTAGGRVLTLVSGSRERVYAAAEQVRFRGKQYRRDLGASEPVAAGPVGVQA